MSSQNVKNRFSGIKTVFRKNLEANLMVMCFSIFFSVKSIMAGNYKEMIVCLAALMLYGLGRKLQSIRKYLPLILSIAVIPAFIVAGVDVLLQRDIPMGFASLASVVLFFSIIGFDSINGSKCTPYCIAMFGAEMVLCFCQDTRGMVVLIGALVLAVMLTNSTYTAMSKYVVTLFLSVLLIKLVGVWHLIRGTRAEGMLDTFIKSPVLYIILVILGLVSVLLRERHPRIKSDRDKKVVPSLKRWQIIIGMGILMTAVWGNFNFDSVFSMQFTGISDSMKWNLIYLVGSTQTCGSVMTEIIENGGYVSLQLFMLMLIAFVYKAYENHKKSGLFSDKMMILIMIGLLISLSYFDLCIPVVMIGAVLAGVTVNGDIEQD